MTNEKGKMRNEEMRREDFTQRHKGTKGKEGNGNTTVSATEFAFGVRFFFKMRNEEWEENEQCIRRKLCE
jgi:hypothetical protein